MRTRSLNIPRVHLACHSRQEIGDKIDFLAHKLEQCSAVIAKI